MRPVNVQGGAIVFFFAIHFDVGSVVRFADTCWRVPVCSVDLTLHCRIYQLLGSCKHASAATPLSSLTRSIRFNAAADAAKREDEERVQQVFPAFLHPHHPAVRHTAHQLEAGSSRKRLLDAVRNRALPLPAAGGRMLSTAKKAIAMQKVTGFGSHASGPLPPSFDV